MDLLLAVLFSILGLIIGSFLNVVIFRLNTNKSLGGRSGCMSCLNKLSWFELIPLFSFLGLRGRCRKCKTKISIQYPLVEFVTGLFFALLFFKFSVLIEQNVFIFAVVYAYYAVMFSVLVVIAVYDLKHKIIPDKLALIFGALAFIGLFFFHNNGFSGVLDFYTRIPSVLEFLSGIFISLPFVLLWFVSSGRWMGFGDAKLAIGIGWLLGLTSALSSLVIAFWSGAIVGICLIFISHLISTKLAKNSRISGIGMKSEIPFAPFLVFGAFLAFFFGFNFFGF
jgi:leader peptidase (prepilin peptidase) / N-methyltransferase